MSWRTVIIADRAKIDYAMGYMAVRGREVRKVFMDEIGTVIIESTAVSLTAAWVSECLRRKIKIIFCDGKHDPAGEVIPYYGSGDTSRKVREQAKWTAERKAVAWQCVIREKIRQQAAVLREFGFDEDAGQLDEYREGVQPGDRDNREGQAAKVYFHALCGRGFSRRDADVRNAALNYGYAVLLAACNREIASSGYLTQFGLFHDNTYNPFNLGSDLMEPFRPVIDRHVLSAGFPDFRTEEKRQIVSLMNREVRIGGKRALLTQAVGICCRRVLDAMESGDMEELREPWYEV